MSEGFKPALSSSQQRTKGLPVDWNTKFINEWIFEYTRSVLRGVQSFLLSIRL